MYGTTTEHIEELCVAQGHSCAICGKHESLNNHGKLEVDHDHVTGRIRGLLCGKCNKAIGLLQDNAGLLRAAADYLEKE